MKLIYNFFMDFLYRMFGIAIILLYAGLFLTAILGPIVFPMHMSIDHDSHWWWFIILPCGALWAMYLGSGICYRVFEFIFEGKIVETISEGYKP